MDFESQLIEDFGDGQEVENQVPVVGAAVRIDIPEVGGPPKGSAMRGAAGKAAYAIRVNVGRLVEEEGIECVGFLTLTIGDHKEWGFQQVFDMKEASKRFNSLRAKVITPLFSRSVVVTERHKSGAIHFHVVGALRSKLNIKSGFDFAAVKRGDYQSARPELSHDRASGVLCPQRGGGVWWGWGGRVEGCERLGNRGKMGRFTGKSEVLPLRG